MECEGFCRVEAANLSSVDTTCCKTKIECKHCGEPAGENGFCCSGCEAAYHAAAEAHQSTIFSGLAHELEDGEYRLELGAEGIHCASCIRLIENALASENEVTYVRVNMTTERLSFSWKGVRERGDALSAKVSKLGYKLHALGDNDKHGETSETEKNLIRAIAVAGFAAGNLMLVSIGLWSTDAVTMGVATRDLFHWVSALIALPTVIYSGMPFFRSALSVLKEGHTNMDVPISLAVVLASAMSISEVMRSGEHVYFDSAVMLLFFLLIGRYLDARAKGKARTSASRLLSKLAGTAAILEEGKIKRVPIMELHSGMTVVVAVGENIPADGTITKGETEVDMSLISGETLPQHVQEDGQVFAGTLNLSAPFEMVVTKASENSLLSEIVRMMEVAEQGAAKYVRLADRAAKLYTPVVHTFGLFTFLGWWLLMGADWQVALLNAVTVLIITCPCALGLAVPVVQVLASGNLLKAGILLKSGDALERLATVDTIVFDKTGTLTLGKPELLDGDYAPEHLKLAASLAGKSNHPLSQAITRAYDGEIETLDVKELPGKGLQTEWDGKNVQLGSRRWCGDENHGGDAVLELWLAIDGKPEARFAFADQLRRDTVDVIKKLKKLGVDTYLLSGDRQVVADEIGREAGVDHVTAEVNPTEKSAFLKDLQAQGKKVLMVGDGLNDAPALAAADASMSPSTAVDISQNTADIVFQGEKLMPVYEAVSVARYSTKLVAQNFGLAIIYNIIAIPLAIMGYVTPMVAAAAMSGSSLVVILNAFRLNLRSKN
nr:heavy metal translocating P-type ATPase [Kordiimonas laminariae]